MLTVEEEIQQAFASKPAAPETPAPPAPIRKGRRASPWKILIYGHPGVGKSTLATKAPKPFFLDLENGLERVDCDATPTKLQTYDEMIQWMGWVINHTDYQTIVIDTVDEIEKMLALRALDAYNQFNVDKKKIATIADAPWGKGDDWLLKEWRVFLDVLDRVQAKGKNVIVTGHERIEKMRNPTGDDYDFYTMNINKKAWPVVTAKFDAVFFARTESFVKDVDERSGKGKATTTGKRILHTSNGTSYVAKNRFDLLDKIPMDKTLFDQLT